MGRSYKTNEVKVDIGSYIHYWRGIRKVGKTTLFKELITEQYGDPSYGLLISCGNEDGYKALDGLVYDVAEDWATLIDIVDDLVQNKSDNQFEMIGLDTVDEIIKLAQAEVKRLNRKQTGKALEFNACFGGYGAPRNKVNELVDEILTQLGRAGYGIILIGHTKYKDIKEKNGDEYQQLTSNLNSDYDNIFANKADIIMTIAVEKNIEDERIEGVERYMWFRTDGFVDCGGRFSEMPDKVPYGARNYIDAFEEGVKKSILTKVSDKDIANRRKKEIAERKKKGNEYVAQTKKMVSNVEENEKLIEIIKAKYSDTSDEIKEQIKNIMADYDIQNFKDADVSTEGLKKIIDLLA